MTIRSKVILALVCAPFVLAASASAQERPAAGAAPAPAPHPGRDILMAKCFQCHTDAMWRDQRQDVRNWEATLYRMVGRGGLWTTDEIKQMADYLGRDFGPNARPAAAAPAR
jgi:mono/diheme cytochrome c family protein